MQQYKVVGLMSGTSLDGLDIAFCNFTLENSNWKFSIEKAETIPYSKDWKHKLKISTELNGLELTKLDLDLGTYFGQKTKEFLKKHNLSPDFIASHGHTIFHQTDINLTLQIGNGFCILKETGINVINNFRALDVILGGQGAPLVPIGDQLLFSDYEFCLNIGGIANISFQKEEKRIAYDICPANMILNYLAGLKSLEYDENGILARKGKVIPDLLDQFNALPYYNSSYPKSLGYEWVKEEYINKLKTSPYVVEDLLAICVEHIVSQVSEDTIKIAENYFNKNPRMLITGGGALNNYLIEKLKEKLEEKIEVVIPDLQVVNFKEALIFAFLGVLRMRGENNCLQSVTGASRDNCGGVIYNNFQN
jgi:anhydro-N-acetylmuramic acid kinase